MLFVGEFQHTLDAKNRIFIPAKYRDSLGESFYIACKMNSPCLAIYTEADMEGFVRKLEAVPDSEVAAIKQALFSMAAQVVTPILSGTLLKSIGYWTLFPYASFFVAAAFVTMRFVRHGDAKAEAKGGLAAFSEMDVD